MSDSRAIRAEMDMLTGLERALNAKPARPPRRLWAGRTLSSRDTRCSRCRDCVASFNLDWKPFCDTCHSYEHEVRRLQALVDFYKAKAQ